MLASKLTFNEKLLGESGTEKCFPFLFFILEFKPESKDSSAKILWAVLHAVRRHQHPYCSDEQCVAAGHEDAPDLWPERVHIQAKSIPKREREAQPNVQGPGFPAGHARGAVFRYRNIQCPHEDTAERLPGKEVPLWFPLNNLNLESSSCYVPTAQPWRRSTMAMWSPVFPCWPGLSGFLRKW